MEIPWPVEDKKYDLFLALQVIEHLEGKQKEVFDEIKRISKQAIVSVPNNWKVKVEASRSHDGITAATLKEWSGREPIFSKVVQCRLIQHYVFEE